MIKKAKKKS